MYDLSTILSKPLKSLSDDEYNTIKQYAMYFKDGMTGKLWFDIISRAAEEVREKEDLDKALELIDAAYKEVDRVYPQMFDEKSNLLKRACLYCIQEKNNKNAHKKMEEYLYNALAQVHYTAMNQKMPYYSFRKFSPYSLKDIEEETICLAHPREFNDPLDTILVYWLDAEIRKNSSDEIKLKYRLLMKKVAEHIKIRCLIAGSKFDGSGNLIPVEDLNVLMWSHYADSHKGFCVKYEFDNELFDLSKNPNKDKILLVDKIKYSPNIDIGDEPSIRMALFEKSDFWKYENEMRLVSYDFSGKDEDFPTIKCKGAIKAIYLGVKCSDANRRLMEKAIGDKNIPLYQMSVDEKKLTRFNKTLIG